MAESVPIGNGPSEAKLRSPWAVAIFSVITIGIYFIFWWYFINREMRDLGESTGRGEELGDSPGTSVLAVTLGALVIVPALVSLYRGTQRVQAASRAVGRPDTLNGWIALILYLLLFPAFAAYLQSDLNNTWLTQSGARQPAGAPSEGAAAQPPPPPPAAESGAVSDQT
jgi:membrane protease YdiL (CAAX protease family)